MIVMVYRMSKMQMLHRFRRCLEGSPFAIADMSCKAIIRKGRSAGCSALHRQDWLGPSCEASCSRECSGAAATAAVAVAVAAAAVAIAAAVAAAVADVAGAAAATAVAAAT